VMKAAAWLVVGFVVIVGCGLVFGEMPEEA
jgi:hypothetical protein